MSDARIHKVASIPGDGIGIEVVEQTIKVLQALQSLHRSFTLQFENFDWSSKTFLATGEYIPEDAWTNLKSCDAILFGAVGSPGKLSSFDSEPVQSPGACPVLTLDRCRRRRVPLEFDLTAA